MLMSNPTMFFILQLRHLCASCYMVCEALGMSLRCLKSTGRARPQTGSQVQVCGPLVLAQGWVKVDEA